ncbi:MAG: sulfite exporter TauE/SafE family protein [Chloroflexi bacterium]|nr:sulfite exporter TauE/SafE family protein [Chloroflexota bacterium]
MNIAQASLLFLAAVVGGMLNAVAGGGSFFGFPALLFCGVPAIPANATNTIALWLGSVASIGPYRHELSTQRREVLILLIGTSLVGGMLGAVLLLKTPATTFTALIPYLLLIATALFAFSPAITTLLRTNVLDKTRLTWRVLGGVSVAQLIISIYGGYFGGGIGILMLATLSLMGVENIHVMNALKTVLASFINGIAVIAFIVGRAIFWPQAIVMIVGAIIGGYGAAYYARKIEQRWVRLFVIIVGVSLTVYFFLHISS